MKPGDTVDPRTLPVGARVKADTYSSSAAIFRIVEAGKSCVNESYREDAFYPLNFRATLVSLPQPIADEGSDVASSLPTYDQIAGWLGAEWVMLDARGAVAPREWKHGVYHSPWLASSGKKICSLKHTPTGQRVEVTAPKEAMSAENWEFWFTRIARASGWIPHTYESFVRWLDPDTKTSTGSGGAAKGNPAGLNSSEHECLDAPSAGRSEPRWQTTDPARIATLEAKLAEQVASGGQDCKAARSLVERADRLRREEQERLVRDLDALNRHQHLRGEIVSCGIQPGPRLMRHELPEAQRACWKRR